MGEIILSGMRTDGGTRKNEPLSGGEFWLEPESLPNARSHDRNSKADVDSRPLVQDWGGNQHPQVQTKSSSSYNHQDIDWRFNRHYKKFLEKSGNRVTLTFGQTNLWSGLWSRMWSKMWSIVPHYAVWCNRMENNTWTYKSFNHRNLSIKIPLQKGPVQKNGGGGWM